MNNIILIGAMAGGASGAVGYFLAGKVHGDEKINQLYPLYSVIFFGLFVLATKLIAL
jgi:hypothetical protein